MRLLHWNVHMWQDANGDSNVQAVADVIEGVGADVVSLVEVDEPWGQPEGLRGLADKLDYCWAYVPAFEYRGEGGFGNALLTRHPFRALQQWQLLSPRLFDGSEPSEPRAVVFANVNVDGQSLWVGSTHLPRHESTMRTAASDRLLQLLDRLGGPCVLCGDFNQQPSAWLPDTTAVVPEPAVATYPAHAPDESIDYCVLKGLAGEAEVLASTASDHLPIVVTANFTTPRGCGGR